MDAAGGAFLHEHFRRNGIDPIVTNDGLAEIRGGSSLSGIRTSRGQTIGCDFLGVGLTRSVSWLAGSGVAITPRGVALGAARIRFADAAFDIARAIP